MEAKPKRSQVLVPVPMKPEFIKELAAALIQLGYSNRADFIRDAILEKLEREGEIISPTTAAAPSRSGKGGRKSSSIVDLAAKQGTKILENSVSKSGSKAKP